MDFWTVSKVLEMGRYSYSISHNKKTNGVTIVVDGNEEKDYVVFEFDTLGFLIPRD